MPKIIEIIFRGFYLQTLKVRTDDYTLLAFRNL